jgi:hypothetical protein
MMADELDLPRERRTVEVDIKGTHKIPDQHLLQYQVLADDVIDRHFEALFDRDDFLLGRYNLGINNRAVRRAHNPVSGRGFSWRISEKPDVTPIEERTNKKQTASRQETCKQL